MEEFMDDKTLTAVSTSLALFQIQLNALLLLIERQHPTVPIREQFQQLVSEGVDAVGMDTMASIKQPILDGITEQN